MDTQVDFLAGCEGGGGKGVLNIMCYHLNLFMNALSYFMRIFEKSDEISQQRFLTVKFNH